MLFLRPFYLLLPYSTDYDVGRQVIGVGEMGMNLSASLVVDSEVISEGVASSVLDIGVDVSNSLIGEGDATGAPIYYLLDDNLDVLGEGVAEWDLIGSSGTTLDIYDEGVLVKSNVDSINFVGSDVIAKEGATEDVDVFIPPPSYVSHIGTTDGSNNPSMSDISTTNRYVASPTSEGVPFFASTWADGSAHPTTRTSPLTWSTAANCLFDDLSTVLTVTVTDPSGTIATHSVSNITGNVSTSAQNITITISGWATNSDKYQASISVQLDVATLLPNSGVFSIEIKHTSGGNDYTFTQ